MPGTRTWPYGDVMTEIPPSLGNADRRQVADVTDSGIPSPQYTRPLPSEFYQLNSPPQNQAYPRIPQTTTTNPGFYGRHTLEPVSGRAQGGPITAGRPYVVGEQGPEVVVPQQSGTVVPTQVAQALPPGYSYVEEPPLPSGFSYVDETPEKPSKVSRFLEKVTPEGPISGVLSLMRTAGQAVQGQRPDLLTQPEGAIPEAVQGMVAGTGSRGVGQAPRIFSRLPEAPSEPVSPAPLQLTYQPKIGSVDREAARAAAAYNEAVAKRAAAQYPLSEEPIIPPTRPGQTPPPSPLLPAQTVREFGAVRRGVELREQLNPESPRNVAAREQARKQALATAIRPHINSIEAVNRRTTAPVAALEAALPSMTDALSTPGKAASVANWMRVYERAARAQFTPQAKASLDLATRNLNNNLGTDLTLKDVLP
jgi:hypothetical protein